MAGSDFIQPGRTIGVLGGGQLGRMAVLAGHALGYRFHVYDPAANSPAGRVADFQTAAAWDDDAALAAFGRSVEAVTLEFENIPVECLNRLQAIVPVRPRPQVLHICQNRRREKEFLRASGFPCAEFRVVESARQLAEAAKAMNGPCVLKTADFGYDGKGQVKIEDAAAADYDGLWAGFGAPVGVVEKWVDFIAECSVICARSTDGSIRTLPLAENEHRNHILHRSIFPARFEPSVEAEACSLAEEITNKLDVVGLLTVELFVGRDGRIVVNELAPRPHNSGHFSINGCRTSQFEQLIRAVAGLPTADASLHTPGVMVNLLGDVWHDSAGDPNWQHLLAQPGVHLHLYDKGEPRRGRKMGHFTVLDENREAAIARSEEIFQTLAVDKSEH